MKKMMVVVVVMRTCCWDRDLDIDPCGNNDEDNDGENEVSRYRRRE